MTDTGRGLTPQEVAASRAAHGDNGLTRQPTVGFWRQFLSNFGDPIIRILLAALGLNLLFFFRNFDWFETVGIAAAVLVATLVSTLSERGSEAAFERLQQQARDSRCRVQRARGEQTVPVAELVVGDLVPLQAGDEVPADGTVIAGRLTVDQAALNGESRETAKYPAPDPPGQDPLAAPGRLCRGVLVCGGEGLLRVTAVGEGTLFGKLARQIQAPAPDSPLKQRLTALGRTLSRWGFAAAALVAAADLFHALVWQNDFDPARIAAAVGDAGTLLPALLHALTLAVTVLVVAVPEGLPMMITLVLSRNMRRMLRDQVLVRKPVGLETAGSLNLLFTDKTGTLTRGKLQVDRLVTGDGRERRPGDLRRTALWQTLTVCCGRGESVLIGGRPVGGNATDRALLSLVLPLPKDAPPADPTGRIPFDSARKFSAVRLSDGRWAVRGAPDKLLPVCTRCLTPDGRVLPLGDRRGLDAVWGGMTARAMRVVALAVTESAVTADGPLPALTLVALAGMRDAVRPHARAAVDRVRQAGIQVVMITGDHPATAAAVARECGLLPSSCRPGEEGDALLTSRELAAMSDGELARRLPALRVVARALPADKSRLVRAAQAQGLVTGMTGDGVNDAPALKAADVGFSMGSGTAVAKEAGDIVILDDDFASIGQAVLYGRTVFQSIRKFLVYQLGMNLCAVAVSVLGPFVGVDAPVTVMQMLWINMIMDTLGGLAFAGEAPDEQTMREPPKRREEPLLNGVMIGQIACMGLTTVALCLAFWLLPQFGAWFGHRSADRFYTAFFALFIFAGIGSCFNARTSRLDLLAGLGKNRSFLVIMGLIALIQLALIYFGGSLFRSHGLSPRELVRVILLASAVLPVDLMRRAALRLSRRPAGS